MQNSDSYIKVHKRRSLWKRIVTVLSCFVVFCTTYALILPAITMTSDTFCGIKEHTHTDECYKKTLICPLAEGGHRHSDACYKVERILICEKPEGHVHTDACYTRPLICGLDESAEHTHSDSCYGEPELTCGIEAGHRHSDDCYREEKVLICGEDEGHWHTDACYEKVLVCKREEHEHTLSCYSDPEADRETESVWKRTITEDLKDNWADNLLAVAESQLGYAESSRNYLVDDSGDIKGYTRYGDWYGIPYGDWCAMYVSFCLHYAGIQSSAFPYDSVCARWIERLSAEKMYLPADEYTPQPGDIVFFDWDDDELSDHVGIYTGCGVDELDGDYITTIEGNIGDTVAEAKHFLKDKTVMGYGILPENPDEGKDDAGYICGLTEHTHTADCYGDDELICGLPEHTHSAACRAAVTEFTYEDDEMSMLLRVEGAGSLGDDVSLAVAPVDDGSAYESYAADDSAQLILRRVSLMQDGAALDTSAYDMTAEISVKPSVLEPLAAELAELSNAAPETELGIVVSVLREDDTETVSELDSVLIAPDEAAPTLTVPVQDGTIALMASASANPHYTVQYYAYIPRFAASGEKSLTVFDTSGKRLPANNTTNPTKQLYLNPTGSNTGKNAGNATANYRVATEETLTRMYTDNQFEYIKAPNTSYINKLIDNDSYTLTEVWVLKDGKSADSMDSADWTIYSPNNVHFTNRADVAKDNIIFISDNTCIRLIYKCKEASFTTPSTFYDYDISSGQNTNGTWRTGITGINSESNYGTSRNGSTTWRSYRDVLAFGNANCGTGMANYKFSGVYLNRSSGDANNFGCTFGLVTVLSEGKLVYNELVYNEYISAPKLFNDGNATGKHTYENSSLTFSKIGDTYTLSSASVNGLGSIDGLQDFFHPSPTSAITHTHILTNDFWPMDSATDKTDPLFGSYSHDVMYQGFASADGISGNWADESAHLPYSDDGRDHNSFFGMQYAVSFTLTEDYVGPLEYYFFGDDDMWVFLDGQLICDIGGVHSSVGEYVNLWDYLEQGTAATHTLTFFYTERGASGSTCYMNFTLPSVSGVNIEQKTTELTVSKTVLGEDDSSKDFSFNIRFYGSDGSENFDDYVYSKYGADGKEIESDLIIHDKGGFSLKAGEYIKIKYLPYGLRYEITEQTPSGYTVTHTINGVLQSGSTATGTVIMDAENIVKYTNTLYKVGMTLQKLSPDGVPLSGAVFGLKDSDGNDVNFISDGSGSYTVPSGSSDYIDAADPNNPSAATQYYIVSSINHDYVIGQEAAGSHPDAKLQKKTDADTQKYRIYRQPDGSYSFQSVANKDWLDLNGGLLTNGNNIHFWNDASVPTANDNQKWYIIANSDGTVTLKPRTGVLNKSNSVLDLNGATIAESTNIHLWESNKSGAQKWLIVPVNSAAEQSVTQELAVGDDGILRISGLLPGSYTLTELNAPSGCVLLDTPVTVHIDANGKVTVSGNDLVSVDGSGGASVVKVTNRYPDRELTLEKQVLNKDTKRKFTFTVSYTDIGGAAVKNTLSLADGEKAAVKIPYNATVTISEAEHDGYALTFRNGQTVLPSQGGSYTFVMKQDVTVTAVNTAGYELPETGGGGTAGIYTAGSALLIAAAGLLMYGKVSRRRNASSV